ncbi:MAG: hypothetical protein R3E88_18840 [Myxococcota bacterium]|nr:hypothetical protein [Myxococcales bacterium]
MHGTLVRVHGSGALLVGPSGIGKSECALDLVARGHALVADDVVRIERRGDALVGTAPPLIRSFLEIRGLGLLYLPDLYGEAAVCVEASVDLVCRLEEWREGVEFDRIGAERATEERAGVAVPVLRLPARPAGSMATLVEAAVREQRLRASGATSAAARIDEALREGRRG